MMSLWICLAGVKPNPKCKGFRRFGKGKGAYVHIAAWAESRAAFEQRIIQEVDEIDCVLHDFDDVDLLDNRMRQSDYPDEFIDILKTATSRPEAAVFGEFHIWLKDDAN